MFERYTERARRVIFFARYEASQVGSMSIESDHLLLALIREDKNLTAHFLRNAPLQDIRKEIEARSVIREKIPTSIDLPLSAESRDILAYANEESERLGHTWIGTEHLLLGILRQGTCPAAEILKARGLNLEEIQRALATDFAATQMQSVTRADRVVHDVQALVSLLIAGQFEETLVHLSKASDAFSQGQLAITQLELRELLNSLVRAIQQRNPNPATFAPLFSGFDWKEPLREFNSELSTEEDCGFKFQLTLLLAELLLKRYRIQR
jgi:ATP-dependent Clp protease ATP-binding subunit ClpA